MSGGIFDRLRAGVMRAAPFLAASGVSADAVIDEMLGPCEASIGGRRLLMFGSNNYLGLTFHPHVVAAAREALETCGTGTTGSRVANGTLAMHRRLEGALARLFEVPAAVIFTTGYQANLATIGALCDADAAVLLDADSHASIWDAARLSGATVIPFRHNSPDSLDRKLRRLPASTTARLVVVEGLYSIRADTSPIRDLVNVAKQHGAHVMVDEAHSFGVYGPRGRGWCEQEGVLDDVDFIVGTFSKSLGGIGGFCVSKHEEIRAMPFISRPYVFTAAGAPATIAGATAALTVLESDSSLRTRLWDNVHRLRAGLGAAGYSIGPVAAPIVPIFTGHQDETARVWKGLLEQGVYVNFVVPPAAPVDDCLLRASCSAVHSEAQIDRAILAFASQASRAGTHTSAF